MQRHIYLQTKALNMSSKVIQSFLYGHLRRFTDFLEDPIPSSEVSLAIFDLKPISKTVTSVSKYLANDAELLRNKV